MLLEFELEFEPGKAHFMVVKSSDEAIEMLYQDRVLGRKDLWSRMAAGFAVAFSGRRAADLDLLSMSKHLRRDVGLDEGYGNVSLEVWRK